MRNIETLYEKWLNHSEMPRKLVSELKKMSPKAKLDAFYQDAEFGTAGMRGILGAGTNRINIFTIRKAAYGFGLYVIKHYQDAKKRGIVIAHDNRHMSEEFTKECMKTLRSLGIKTFIFDELKPTPLLSYAVRHLNAIGGIMITASHNPKNYNGFKVYDDTGAQLTPEKVDLLLAELKKLPNCLDIEIGEAENGYALLSDDVELTYFCKVMKIQLRRDQPKNGFKIVFSPQHGTGAKLGMRALNVIGYEVIPVADQMKPDPNFTYTKSPNPEEKAAYSEAIKHARAHGAHMIITTDPDADRLGIVVRNKANGFDYLTGNQSAALLLDYLCKTHIELGHDIKGKYLYTTIVSSSLANHIAESYGLKVKEFLTGFKFIGAQIAEDDAKNEKKFFFGYEESYGLLAAPFVRDKDAIQALVLYSEMTLYYHLQGKTLGEVLAKLNAKHGYHHDITKSVAFPGAAGQAEMVEILTRLRNNPPMTLGGLNILKYDDYLTSKSVEKGKTKKLTLPKSDVIRYHLEGGTTISIRPSGTEPKCKIYYGILADNEKEAQDLLTLLENDIKVHFTL
ncbi:MAG: Phosphoglucomutase [Tenericutes bacterium ADurb.Bin239]|nr:MAG: Phosphoglucomutase [Tenericutes bacterium ADurb.Bin239]